MILVTGHSGFIGSHVYFKLKRYFNTPVTGVSRKNLLEDDIEIDLTDNKSVKSLLSFLEPKVIVHFAANPNTKLNQEDPSKIIDDNIKSTMNLLSNCRNNTKFIFASSVTVYGDQQGCDENFPTDPKSIYATTKLACENLINYFTSNEGVLGYNLRLCATIGTGSTHGMLHDFKKKVLSDSDIFTVFGDDPGSIKPFIHVNDVCRSVIHFIENNVDSGTYNVCPDDNLSAKTIAEMFIEKYGVNKSIRWTGSTWAGDNPKIQCSNKKLMDTGFELNHPTSTKAVEEFLREIY